jgi:peptide/nickel transport system substrate-binding protein
MSLIKALATSVLITLSVAPPSFAQEGKLTISVGFGPTAEVPDPRAGYNGWMSNQTGVTETLMGIDYDMKLYPRLAASIDQISPTKWRITLREGLHFHDGSSVTAQSVVDAISPISDEAHAGHNARVANLLDLASITADDDRNVVFETNSPNAAFPWTLSDPGIAVLGGISDAFPINATGPYIFREAITALAHPV